MHDVIDRTSVTPRLRIVIGFIASKYFDDYIPTVQVKMSECGV